MGVGDLLAGLGQGLTLPSSIPWLVFATTEKCTNFTNNLSLCLKCLGDIREAPADCHVQVGSRASTRGNQRAGRPLGEGLVDLAGPRQASGGGQHTGAVEPAGGDREAFWSPARCLWGPRCESRA